jgi:hypothetical protein
VTARRISQEIRRPPQLSGFITFYELTVSALNSAWATGRLLVTDFSQCFTVNNGFLRASALLEKLTGLSWSQILLLLCNQVYFRCLSVLNLSRFNSELISGNVRFLDFRLSPCDEY